MATPEHLGKYEIHKQLGRGAFATVYQALDTTLDREVALKILHPALLTDPTFIGRFKREARAMANLDHPHIATVYEIGETEERVYISLYLARGPNLGAALKEQGPFTWERTLRVLQPLCEALDYAHGKGLVHRDLKPSNILLDSERGPLLTDFGFARLMGDSSVSLSLSGGILGTPAYIAPEVWELDAADPPADIYAMGCILYEMLTGAVLFAGKTPMQSMRAHDRGPQFPETWPEDVPAGIETVLNKALARDPAARYPSGNAFWHALHDLEARAQAAQDAAEQAAVAAQWREETEAAMAEGEWRAAKMAVARWLAVTPKDAEAKVAQAEIEQQLTSQRQPVPTLPSGQSSSTSLSRNTHSLKSRNQPAKGLLSWVWIILPSAIVIGLILSMIAGGLSVLRIGVREADIAPTRTLTTPVDATTISVMEPTDTRPQTQPISTSKPTATPTVQPTEVVIPDQSTLTPEPTSIPTNTPPLSTPTPSPSVTPSSLQISFVNVSNLKLVDSIDVPTGGVRATAFSPDGTILATGGDAQTVWLWRLEDRALMHTLSDPTWYVHDLEFSPDGALLAAAVGDRTARLWQTNNGQLLHTIKGPSSSVTFSPDGKTLAADWDKAIGLWQVGTGELKQTLQGHKHWAGSVSFSPDGTILASGGGGGWLLLWRVSDNDLIAHLQGGDIAFSPDGTLLAASIGGGPIYIWRVTDGMLLRKLEGHTSQVWSIAFNPNGEMLASGGADTTVRLWNVNNGTLLRTLQMHTDQVRSVTFNAEGTLLASGAQGDNTVRLWGLSKE
jgi:serine/threonine protein kinase